MTTHYRTKGFVFKKEDRADADRVFDVFSEDFGMVRVRGRAIRKINSKLKSGIDVFCLSEIEFIEGKNYKTLTDAVIINKFDLIPLCGKKAKIAFLIFGLIDNFVKGCSPDKNTFDLLAEILGKINAETEVKNYELLYDYFLWNFLSYQGYHPEVHKCAACKRELSPHAVYFSCKEGGVACRACAMHDEKAQKINSDIVKILRIILNKDWQTVSKLKIEQASRELFKKVSSAAAVNFCPA